MLAANALQTVLALGSVVVLARLLKPEDFGTAAMVLVVAELVRNFNSFGLGKAFVRAERASAFLFRGLLRLGIRLNAIAAGLLLVIAVPLAWFFREASLPGFAAVLALPVFLIGATTVHRGLCARRMHFGRLAGMKVASALISFAVAAVAALLGAEAWALVLQVAVLHTLTAAGSVALAGGIVPRLSEEIGDGARELAQARAFVRDFTWAKLIYSGASRLDRVLVGRIAAAQVLGLYSAARRWSLFPSEQIQQPMLSVGVSALSKVLDDRVRFRFYSRALFTGLSGAMYPVLAILFLEAESVVRILLGAGWLDVVPLLRALLIAAALRFPLLSSRALYYSEGRTKTHLRWTGFESVVTAIGVGVGAMYGAAGVAWGAAVTALILLIPGLYVCARGSRARVSDLLGPIAMSLAIASSVAASVSWSGLELPAAGFSRLAIVGSAYTLLYVPLWALGLRVTGQHTLIASSLRALIGRRATVTADGAVAPDGRRPSARHDRVRVAFDRLGRRARLLGGLRRPATAPLVTPPRLVRARDARAGPGERLWPPPRGPTRLRAGDAARSVAGPEPPT
ncbi:MAG: oligosaccharide flippase family protein [Gemmatimonadetes bacterium]|nr:oligosaccharide flippase family protein [Gemmatimonadota bacterium]